MSISVHVFGGAKGESIVIEFPDGTWGVIDCYSHSSSNLEKNPVARFLLSRGVGDLDFVCLTHPHDDHFSGIQQILENFSVKQFWHFGAMSTDRLAQFIKIKIKEDEADSKATGRKNNSNRLAELWKLVTTREKASEIVTQRLTLGHRCVPVEDERGFTIDAIGTSTAQANRFESLIKHSFDSGLKFNPSLNHRDSNLCSCGMLIVYGETRILLGGDIEEGGWQDLISQRSYLGAGVHFVKVAHHGSPNGYCDGLWELHREGINITYKVLTPYKRFDLPKNATIEHLERHGGQVFSAGDPYFDHQFSPTFVTSSQILRKETRTAENKTSRVSFTFDDNGNSTNIELEEEAIRIC